MKNFNRFSIVGYIFSFMAILIVAQMIRIQNSSGGQELLDESKRAYEYRYERIQPERGNIYDRWGYLMAGNEVVYELGVNLADKYLNPDTIAYEVSRLLKMDYDTVYARANSTYQEGVSQYAVLTDFVSAQDIETLQKLQEQYNNTPLTRELKEGEKKPSLSALTWAPHLKRTYPENSLASNVLGFYSFLDRAAGGPHYGVEEQYNDLLAGEAIDVKIPLQPRKISEIPSVPPGSSLVLTIDRKVQAAVEDILDRAVKGNGAKSGTIIVTDPRNGEILAMATSPRMNPNEYWKANSLLEKAFNRAVDTTYEPGSVFKVITMASAIDAGVVQPDTPFLDTGVYELGGYSIYNWDRSAWGPQTMLTCMQHSLNVCLTWVAVKLGPNNFYDYLTRFGVGRRSNIDLANEKIWPLAVPGDENWYPVNLGTNSFGQGLAVAPIQMITAVSALANDGKMMAPHVVKAVISDNQTTEIQPRQIGTPISAQSAHAISEMLAISLEEEASSALVDGYRMAGKTGTAEIAEGGGYTTYLTNASFVGWGPVGDPRIIVYVWLEKPTSSPWGSVVASPIFQKVVESLVVLLDIPPDSIREQLANN